MKITLVLAVLLVANVLNNRIAPGAYLLTCMAASAILLAIGHWDGLSWSQLGLGTGSFRTGLRWSVVLAALVLAVYLVGLALPFTRDAFLDERAADLSAAQALWKALVVVPFGTVLLEETAFRGVLWAMVEQRRGTVWATGVSSALFGFWHLLPSRGLTGSNVVVAGIFGTGPVGRLLAVVAAVLGTAAAGVVFCELRRRSGSLLAPAGLHWALNGLGYLLAWTASRRIA